MDSNELVIALIVVFAGIIVLRSKAANSATTNDLTGAVPPQTMPSKFFTQPH